jgi:hypothetical protein
MKKLPLLLVLSALLIFSSSCKKDDTAPPTRADILASRVWRLEAHTISPAVQVQGQALTDIYQYFGTTYQDNLIRFNRNPNNYTVEEGQTKADQAGSQVTDAGSWMLNSDESVLVLNSANGQVFSVGELFETEEGDLLIVTENEVSHLSSYNIVELTDSRLSYSFSYRQQQNGPIYTQTLTYIAQ